MKKILSVFVFAIAMVFTLSACTNQDTGVLAGGVLGGLVGSQFGKGSGKVAATVGGALLGAYIGGRIGANMDRADRLKMVNAIDHNPDYKTTQWRNPNSGYTYNVTPTNTYYNRSDQPCRDYTTKAIIGGKTQTIYGKACRMADGTWKVVK